MYEHFFGLQARPFDLTPDPRYLVMTDVHREVLSNLEYAFASRKGVTVLTRQRPENPHPRKVRILP